MFFFYFKFIIFRLLIKNIFKCKRRTQKHWCFRKKQTSSILLFPYKTINSLLLSKILLAWPFIKKNIQNKISAGKFTKKWTYSMSTPHSFKLGQVKNQKLQIKRIKNKKNSNLDKLLNMRKILAIGSRREEKWRFTLACLTKKRRKKLFTNPI